MKAYRFLIEARNEFHEQIGYFDTHSPALGDRFVDAVEAAIRDFRTYPQIGSPVSRRVRQRVLRGFPYSVLYVDTPAEIIIVAVAPHKRRPGYWRKRLRNLRR
ncbi:MAG TPA: type II toxin-antitoxin system RelE/ParE family toxin [Thermoanaerobaculia bacterium]|nr:type II toxin-antitoxin system RelE/ParE family toxin [Thermoanaerobaculia bacterium]